MPLAHARPLALLLAAPIATCVLGLVVQRHHGVGSAHLALGLGALVVAVLVAALLAALGRRRLDRAAPVLTALALVLLALSLVDPGLQGVHRWLALGPVRLHASSLASPLVLAAAVALAGRGAGPWAAAAFAIAQAIHGVQPDAGQSTALALGIAAALATWAMPTRLRVLALAITAASIVPAWRAADPLAPVPEVEGIVTLAAELGRPVQLLAIVLLALVPLTLRSGGRASMTIRSHEDAGSRVLCNALSAYVAGIVLVPALGDFPVPLLGWGVSPVLGVALCVGWVAAHRRCLHDRANV